MFDQELFKKNLPLLKVVNEPLATSLERLFSEKEPLACSKKDLENWFASLNLEGITVFYVYGVGSGEIYEVILPWLKENREHWVVFLEDDLESLRYFLGTPLAHPLLENPQVDLQDISRAQTERQIMRHITQDNMLRPATITALPSYQNYKAETFTLVRDLLIFETAEQNILNQELIQYGSHFFSNFYQNLMELPLSYDGTRLFQEFKNIPAIICGAGPSLINQIPFLKTLSQKALIIAPSSAQNILTAHAIWPHFGIIIDPISETYHRQSMQRGFETPIIYQNRVHGEALSTIQGPKIYMPGSSFYLIQKWFEEELGLPSLNIQGGGSSVNAAVNYAQLLGCNPIIFVGLDLSKNGEKQYASGIEKNPLFPPVANTKTYLGQEVKVKDIHGREVTSYWTWISEAHWIDNFQRQYPSVKLINATQAGIGFFSIPNESLEEVTDLHLKQNWNLDLIVHEAIQQAGLIPVQETRIRECLEKFKVSLQTCLEIYHRLFNGSSVADEEMMRLQDEIAYRYFLNQMDDFYSTLKGKEQRLIHRIQDLQDKADQQQALDQSRYQFLMNSIQLNLRFLNDQLRKEPLPIPQDQERPIVQPNKRAQLYYYPSGDLYSIQTFDQGLRDGTHFYYYPDGSLKSEINYHQGQLNGTTKLYFPHGQLKRKIIFQIGERHGTESSWYPNGQLFTQIEYEHNVPKQARCWQENGILAKEIHI